MCQTIQEVDSLQINQLLAMEELQMGMAAVYARNILLALDEIAYDEPILFPDQLKSSQAFEDYQELLNTEPPKQLEVYPNPSDDYIIISYRLEMDKKGSVIEFSNLNGINFKVVDISNKQDQLVVDTQNWKPGIYIATLKINGNSKESIKFTVVK